MHFATWHIVFKLFAIGKIFERFNFILNFRTDYEMRMKKLVSIVEEQLQKKSFTKKTS